ncbi:tripartite tricarboxylate transporter TctB family protein [Humitalea sp. 24SJ18S-53]|uniref:tripartite tricarboxylate transporter TctB family protein n=1 Tax=Humitalea sp. 24SJ18S-53 TaxID=3422307 RepID=UPI003D664092
MPSRLQLELGFAALIFLIGVGGLIGSQELDTGWQSNGPQAGFFPFRVALILMAASVLVALQAWRARAAHSVAITDQAGARRVLSFALPIIGLVALSQWIGLYLGMLVYLIGTIRWQGGRPWMTSIAIGVVFTVVVFLVFEKWFQVPLLKGPLEIMLGLG